MTHSEPVLVAGDAKTRDAARPSGLDEAAFNDIYRQVARPLWAYLRRLTGSAALADDLMQEAFTRLLVQPDPPGGQAAQRAWLFRVATNLAIDGLGEAGARWRRMLRCRQGRARGGLRRSAAREGDGARLRPSRRARIARCSGWHTSRTPRTGTSGRRWGEGSERSRAAVPRAQEAGGHLDPPARGAGKMSDRPCHRNRGCSRRGVPADQACASHVAGCESCREAIEALEFMRTLAAEPLDPNTGSPSGPHLVARATGAPVGSRTPGRAPARPRVSLPGRPARRGGR